MRSLPWTFVVCDEDAFDSNPSYVSLPHKFSGLFHLNSKSTVQLSIRTGLNGVLAVERFGRFELGSSYVSEAVERLERLEWASTGDLPNIKYHV
jgi:hypothetical protein